MPDDAKNAFTRLKRLLREAVQLTKTLSPRAKVEAATASSSTQHPSRYHVERYPNTRFFALYDGEDLLAVTVYRKGAEAVRERLQAHEARIAALMQGQPGEGEDSPEPPGAVERLQAARAAGKAHPPSCRP